MVTDVDRKGYREFLRTRHLSDEQIADAIRIVARFEAFLRRQAVPKTLESATRTDFTSFSKTLLEKGLDTEENYLALGRYGRFVKNNDVYLGALELLDGADVLQVLHKKLGRAVGRRKRDLVFKDMGLPRMGTPSTEKPRFTSAVMKRLQEETDPAVCKSVLADVAHGIPRKYYRDERKKFLKAGNIDVYLENKKREWDALLQKHRDEKTLFFNQEITDEVLSYVRSRPDIEVGVRRGAMLVHTKIPYMAKEYLVETDDRMKRYYACHCAWAREAIKSGEPIVSPTFCYCSAGFTKQPWEVALGTDLEVEMVKSALKGDTECTFIVHLPDDVLRNLKE